MTSSLTCRHRKPLASSGAVPARREAVEKKAVILNGVSPWAKVGAKRSEEPSPRDSAWAKAGAILTVHGRRRRE